MSSFVDASFAGDLRDSKSTSGSYLVLIGPNTCVPIGWFCKKQGAVSHSSTEAEIISLDAGLRMEGIPALALWEVIVDVLGAPSKTRKLVSGRPDDLKVKPKSESQKFVESIDYVPCNIPPSSGNGRLCLLEDNDAVIKMTVKGRAPNMRHVMRTHRVDLDFLFERITEDPGIFIRYVSTKVS